MHRGLELPDPHLARRGFRVQRDGPLVDVPHHREALARRGDDVLAADVDEPIALARPGPDDEVERLVLQRESGDRLLDALRVVRVDVPVQVAIHLFDGLRPVRVSEQLAQPDRDVEHDHAVVHELINADGHHRVLQNSLRVRVKFVRLHAFTHLFYLPNGNMSI